MSKEEISIKSTVKPLIYDWEQDGNDLFLHLGLMRKAIVITRMIHDNKSKILSAVIPIARAASPAFDGSFHKMDAHPSGEMTE